MAGFGVYREGSSFAHRLDPRTKVVFVAVFIATGFFCRGWVALALVAATALAMVRATGEGLLQAVRALRPFVPVMVFIGLFDALFAVSGTVWWQMGPFAVSAGGCGLAADSLVRFAAVLLGTSLLMRVTSPTELSDAAELMLAPLSRKGVHADAAILALGMALRFIPVVSQELERVKGMQLLRGAHFDEGGPRQRLKAYHPVLVPLFIGAFHRADTLAYAVVNRGFGCSGHARTSYRAYAFGKNDATALTVLAVFVVLVAVASACSGI